VRKCNSSAASLAATGTAPTAIILYLIRCNFNYSMSASR
jgi:hypothetical protein